MFRVITAVMISHYSQTSGKKQAVSRDSMWCVQRDTCQLPHTTTYPFGFTSRPERPPPLLPDSFHVWPTTDACVFLAPGTFTANGDGGRRVQKEKREREKESGKKRGHTERSVCVCVCVTGRRRRSNRQITGLALDPLACWLAGGISSRTFSGRQVRIIACVNVCVCVRVVRECDMMRNLVRECGLRRGRTSIPPVVATSLVACSQIEQEHKNG